MNRFYYILGRLVGYAIRLAQWPMRRRCRKHMIRSARACARRYDQIILRELTK